MFSLLGGGALVTYEPSVIVLLKLIPSAHVHSKHKTWYVKRAQNSSIETYEGENKIGEAK